MARWGMVIDLDKCVGCQACTIACKEENDVPHGSPEEQRRRREIYWNRVIAVSEREYPTVRVEFISMPCMHCDNAPCATVCPAKATIVTPDTRPNVIPPPFHYLVRPFRISQQWSGQTDKVGLPFI